MCYHNSIGKTAKELEVRYEAKFAQPDLFTPIYHATAFSYGIFPVITNEHRHIIQLYHWGLIPKWVKTKPDTLKMREYGLNSRSETAFDKPMFRGSITYKRCLIPSTGFFEWQTFKGKKYPWFIGVKNEEVFSLAGIWDTWLDHDTGEIIDTYSILTVEANPLMAKIHNTKKRMPVILPRDIEQDWLNDTLTKDDIKAFCAPFDEKQMQAHTISKLITSRSENPNIPAVQEEYKYPELVA